MAGRPRLYASAAEKTRAYRQRLEQQTIIVDRQWFEQTQKDIERLRKAVYAAQDRGDPLALSLRTVTTTEMMAHLSLYFECGVMTPLPNKATGKKR